MKPNHAKKAINRPLQTLALSTAISVGAFGLACVPVSAFAAPVISASANAFSVSKLENGKFTITLDLANNQRGKTILVKNAVSVNGKTTVVTLGRFKAGALGKGSLTVSKNIVVGSALVVSSGAKLLIKRRITSIRNLLAIAPVVPSAPVVFYPPISGAPAAPVDPAIARAALRTAILNAAASKADYLLAGGLAEDSVYTNVTAAVSADGPVTATIVANTGNLIQAIDILYGTVDAANTALLDAVFVLQLYPLIIDESEPNPAYVALQAAMNIMAPDTADLLAKTSAVRLLIDSAIAYDSDLATALANAYVASEAYRQIGGDQTGYSYLEIAAAILGSPLGLNPLQAMTDVLNAATESLSAEQTALTELQQEANVAIGTFSRMGGSQEDPVYIALYDAATAFPLNPVLLAEATEQMNSANQARIASFAALIASQQDAFIAYDAYLRASGSVDSLNFIAHDALINEAWPDVAALNSATAALNADTEALAVDRVAYLAALSEAISVLFVYQSAGGALDATDYLNLEAARSSTPPVTSDLVAFSAALRAVMPDVNTAANLTADEIALKETVGDANAAIFLYGLASGNYEDPELGELIEAATSDSLDAAVISAKTTALIEVTATRNFARAIRNYEASTLNGSLRAYLNAGGAVADNLYAAAETLAYDQTADISALTFAITDIQAVTATNVANYAAIRLAIENASRSMMIFGWVDGDLTGDLYADVQNATLAITPDLVTLITTTAALDAEIAVIEAGKSAFNAAYSLGLAASYTFGANGGGYNDQVHQDLLSAMEDSQPVTATIITLTTALNVATQALIDAQAANTVPQAYAAAAAYRIAGGSIDDAVYMAVQEALIQDPYVALDIEESTTALNAATLALNTAKQAYRDAVIDAAVAMQSHTLAGGLAADTAYAALQALIDANEQVTATLVAAIATLEAATLALG